MTQRIKTILSTLTTLGLAVFVTACCCGEAGEGFKQGWEEGKTEIFSEMERKLEGVEDSEHKETVRGILQDGQKPEVRDKLTIIELGEYQASFDQAVADSKISEDEAKDLDAKYKKISAN